MSITKIKSIPALIARILLGLMYFVFGLNFFFHFIPVPPPEGGPAETFMTGLFSAGYFFPMLKGIEVLLGGFILIGFFVPLSLIILAPISINILLFHAFLAPSGFVIGLVILLLNIYLLWVYRNYYKSFLTPKSVVH